MELKNVNPNGEIIEARNLIPIDFFSLKIVKIEFGNKI
jgi:hypothetical protein